MARRPARSGWKALTALTLSIGLFLLLLVVAARAFAGGVGLAWDPQPSPPAAGYKLYYGPSAGNYPSQIDVGNIAAYTVSGLVEGSTYHFAVTVYDAANTESGYSNDVAATVPYSAPMAQFTGNPTSGNSPLTVNFSNTSTGSITGYAWDFGDGGTSTVVSPSHSYAAAGMYTVSLTVTGPAGSDTQTRSNYVTVTDPGPLANFSGTPTNAKVPLTVAFTNSSTGTITNYAWTFGDGGTSTAAAPTHAYSSSGMYTVSLTVTGPGGSNTKTQTKYIKVTPAAKFKGTPTAGPAPLAVDFADESIGTVTDYLWNFGDGTTSTASNPSKIYSTPGVYTVTLTVTGVAGSDSLTSTNYVTVSAPAPVAQFFGNPTSGVSPLTVNFSNTSAGTITGYTWTFGDGGTSTLANPSHVYAASGVYTVSLTVTGPGGSNTQTRSNYVTVAATRPDSALYRKFVFGTATPLYSFLLDFNSDQTGEARIPFGMAGDVPLVGYISPGGKSSLITYRNGMWNIDTNRSGTADAVVGFGGVPGDLPLIANFSGPGALDDIVIYRAGAWYVQRNLDGLVDLTFNFGGVPGDVPLAGDVNGDGIADLVIYRNGIWYVDTSRTGIVGITYTFGGMPQDIPVLFDWDGDGKANLCIFRDGVWYVSTKRDGIADVMFIYGAPGDLPLVGQFH